VDERGTGLIGTLAGVTAFLVLLLFATQVLVNLYATTTVTAVAFDAARIVAGGGGGPGSERLAEAGARRQLGRAGESADFAWRWVDSDGDAARDHLELRVRADSPTNLLPRVRFPFQTIDRTVRVRAERFR
jgi:hypothetical protein